MAGTQGLPIGDWKCQICGQEHERAAQRDGNYGSTSFCPGHPDYLTGFPGNWAQPASVEPEAGRQ